MLIAGIAMVWLLLVIVLPHFSKRWARFLYEAMEGKRDWRRW